MTRIKAGWTSLRVRLSGPDAVLRLSAGLLMLVLLQFPEAVAQSNGLFSVSQLQPAFLEQHDWTTTFVATSANAHGTAPGQMEYSPLPALPNRQELLAEPPHSAQFSHQATANVFREADPEPKVSRFRNQAFQGVQIAAGTVGGGTDDQYLNNDHVMAMAGIAIPLGSMENVLVISPSFRADFLRFSPGMDLPETLQETGVRFFWKAPISDNLSSLLIVTPSIRNDFTTTDGAVRIFGLAMLTWDVIPDELSLSGGFVYLDRSDMSAIPAAGLTWRPSRTWKLEVQFPQPRLAYRVTKDGANSESWIYLAGGFGGNTWAVTRNGGEIDELTLNDLRLMVGYEKLIANNCGWYVEAGWAFDRSIEYSSVPFEQDFADALLLRAGISF